MPAMHFVPTRSGYGPALVPPPPAPPAVRVRYFIPTPAWMLADGVETRRSMPTDWVGFQSYKRRMRG